ncbi:hypothetical protein V9K67_07700 [Paraflavisolibacter sp. H34]|uniref:hypothetical protein n=1 Tax=Huijunlia imazamoxiresistens TaxID=3127457 RepID=UPI003016B8FE
MHKIYLLLRDNKESGPYSLEELQQLSLKPFDLIWVDGRSAGWQYPGEIESLRAFVAPAPAAATPAPPATSPAPRSPEQTPPLTAATSATKKAPPLPATPPDSARHIYVSLPARATALQPDPSFKVPEPSPEDILERKAEAIRARVQAFTAGKPETAGQEEEDLRTNYTRSLDDMKEEYASWVFRQKNREKRWVLLRKAALVLLVAVLIGIGSYFYGKRLLPSGQQESQTVSLPDVNLSSLPVENRPPLEDHKKEPEAAVLTTSSNLSPPLYSEPEIRADRKQSPSATPAPPPTAPAKASRQKPAKLAPITVTGAESSTSAIPEITSTPPPASHPATEAASPEKTSAADKEKDFRPQQVRLNEQYVWDNNNGIEGKLQLTVQNGSKLPVEMVAVDIFYYGKDNSLLQKKTVYFNNLQPESSASKWAPKLKKAHSIKSEIALVSSKNGMYYLR